MKVSPKKTYAIELLREAIVTLSAVINEADPGYVSKAQLEELQELVCNLILMFNLHRGTLSIKSSLVPWIISPDGNWPRTEDAAWKASDHGFQKPLWNASDYNLPLKKVSR